MRTFNTYFSTTLYPFSILYLPKQIPMDIVNRKLVLNASFQEFLYTNINNHLKYVLIVFFEKSDSKIYNLDF